jgi:hypothetical protein
MLTRALAAFSLLGALAGAAPALARPYTPPEIVRG